MSGFPLEPPSGGVTSWNTRTGAVVPATGDYDASQITGLGTIVNTFNGRDGAVVPASGDYSASEVTNALDLSNTGTQTMQGSLTVDGDVQFGTSGTSNTATIYTDTTISNATLTCDNGVTMNAGCTVNGNTGNFNDGLYVTGAAATFTSLSPVTMSAELTVNAAVSATAFVTNGTSVQSVTIPTSGTALPAVTEDTILYIVGGAITGITLNTNALPTSLPVIYQRPNDTIVIDYTTAPTAIYAQSL